MCRRRVVFFLLLVSPDPTYNSPFTTVSVTSEVVSFVKSFVQNRRRGSGGGNWVVGHSSHRVPVDPFVPTTLDPLDSGQKEDVLMPVKRFQ